jgi:hypothetical protein
MASMRVARSKSAVVRRWPASWVVMAKRMVSQRRSMSAWWPMRRSTSATWTISATEPW